MPADVALPATGRRRVRGLRREEVASLAGIGVSWYTALEHGNAPGVSAVALSAIADVLRLSESERHYVAALAREPEVLKTEPPGPLVIQTVDALTIPAYVVDAAWDVAYANDAMRRVWAIEPDEIPFNAIERLFIHPVARRMHGERFVANVEPVIAMLRSALGRRPTLEHLRRLRDRLVAEDAVRAMWDAYEIGSPFESTDCTIESAIGTFRYRTLDFHVPGTPHGVVVQVPQIGRAHV